MKKATVGGMHGAAAFMLANTKSTKRICDAQDVGVSFDRLFRMCCDRPKRTTVDLFDHPDAPPPTTLLLQLAAHGTPDTSRVRQSLAVYQSTNDIHKATPLVEDELDRISDLLLTEPFCSDRETQIQFVVLLLRARLPGKALKHLPHVGTGSVPPHLWRELVEALARERRQFPSLLLQLLDDELYPVIRDVAVGLTPQRGLLASDGVVPRAPLGSSASASVAPGSTILFGLDEQLCSRLLLVGPSLLALLRCLDRYLATCERSGQPIQPRPFFVFFSRLKAMQDPDTKLPALHWRAALRYFQKLNRSCPKWFDEFPVEAADLVKQVLTTISSGADPYLTLNLARRASSRRILSGVDLSLWILNRLSLAHHVEETRAVASLLVQWLFHTVGIHLIPKFHPQIIPLVRSLVQLDAIDDVAAVYNVIIDHVQLFSDEFRATWIATMRDLVCQHCGSMFQDPYVYHERTCNVCMHVCPAISIAATPSYEITAEHLHWLKQKRRAAARESSKRIHKLVFAEPSSTTESNATRAPSDGNAAQDSATVFEQRVLQSSSHLEIGVFDPSLSSLVLHASASAGDVRAAVEEANRRHALTVQVRETQLQTHGKVQTSGSVAVPSVVPGLVAHIREQFAAARQRAVLQQLVRLDGAWRCVWCQEENSAASPSRTNCSACGAETGPEAPWRTFLSESHGDVRQEIQLRIRSGEPADALIAAYNLMVYRRNFLLMAKEVDHSLVEQLIGTLVTLQERVLAGYLLMRLIPSARRGEAFKSALRVAELFGREEHVSSLLASKSLKFAMDDAFFDAVFDASRTCKVCFGEHDWHQCPIVTRDFSTVRVSINLSPDEKRLTSMNRLRELVQRACATLTPTPATALGQSSTAADRVNAEAVHEAYRVFLQTPHRERFAAEFPVEANNLSRALSVISDYVRAVFVACHIPLHLRFTSTYVAFMGYFGITLDDCAVLLRNRSQIGVNDGTHPNISQVLRVCCVCLNATETPHAAFHCPRLLSWSAEVVQQFGHGESTVPSHAPRSSGGPAGPTASSVSSLLLHGSANRKSDGNTAALLNLKRRVNGWIQSGPERLMAFHRFLIENLDTLTATMPEAGNPVVYAANHTVQRLLESDMKSLALQLYARLGTMFVQPSTTEMMLRAAGYADEHIETITKGSFLGRHLTFRPDEVCLCCFETGHVFAQCPTVVGQVSQAGKLKQIIDTVGSIRTSPVGVAAAADFLQLEYNFSRLYPDLLRSNPPLVLSVVQLARRCFACKLNGRGVRLLRRIPVDMLCVPEYAYMWKACGVPDDIVEERTELLERAFQQFGVVPSSSSSPERKALPNELVTKVAALIHEGQCRHCYEYGHTIAECDVFASEASFGRDFISVYRMATLVPFANAERKCIYAHLLRFAWQHQYVLPYHILGVHSALNALAASFSMDAEPALSLKTLLLIPPAYRKMHAIDYALSAFGVPKLERARLRKDFFVTGDGPVPLLHHRGDAHATDTASSPAELEPQHLLVLRPPIPDLLYSSLFSSIGGVAAAMKDVEQRIEDLILGGLQPQLRTTTTDQVLSAGNGSSSSSSALASVDDTDDFQLEVNFVEESRKLMASVGCTYSASIAASPEQDRPVVVHGPQEKRPAHRNGAATLLWVKQHSDLPALRASFEPIIAFMERLLQVKIGSRSEILVDEVSIENALQESGSGSNQQSESVAHSVPPSTPPRRDSFAAASRNADDDRAVGSSPDADFAAPPVSFVPSSAQSRTVTTQRPSADHRSPRAQHSDDDGRRFSSKLDRERGNQQREHSRQFGSAHHSRDSRQPHHRRDHYHSRPNHHHNREVQDRRPQQSLRGNGKGSDARSTPGNESVGHSLRDDRTNPPNPSRQRNTDAPFHHHRHQGR